MRNMAAILDMDLTDSTIEEAYIDLRFVYRNDENQLI